MKSGMEVDSDEKDFSSVSSKRFFLSSFTLHGKRVHTKHKKYGAICHERVKTRVNGSDVCDVCWNTWSISGGGSGKLLEALYYGGCYKTREAWFTRTAEEKFI